MAKKKNSMPRHMKTAAWFWKLFDRELDHGREELVDVHFRDRATKAGPAGWNCIVQVTRLGETYTHGINFPFTGTPQYKDAVLAFENIRELIDKADTKKSLLVTPEQARKMPKIIPNK